MDFVDGEEILIADKPEAFAAAVASLLADPARCRALGEAARRRVEQHYSLPVLQRAVRHALAGIVHKRSVVDRSSVPPLSLEEVGP